MSDKATIAALATPSRNAQAIASAPTDLVAVQHRHVDVEDDNVDVVLVYDPQRLAAVSCLEGSEARVLQERRLKGA